MDQEKQNELRKKAEELLKQKGNKQAEYDYDMRQFIEELNVHQIELEMQNEQLNNVNKKLMEQEEKYKDLYYNAPIAYFTITETGNIVHLNQSAANMLGLTMVHFQYKSMFHFIEEKSKPVFSVHIKNVFNTGKPGHDEIVLIKEKGEYIYAKMQTAPCFDNELEQNLCRLTLTDLTEKKKAENALIKSEKKFRDLFNLIGDAIFVQDFKGDFIQVNENACKKLGYTCEELLNLKVSDVDVDFSDEDVVKVLQALKKQGEVFVEGTHKTKDNKTFPVEVHSKVVEFEDKEVIISLARDISRRKEAEERFEFLSKATMEGIVVHQDGVALEANLACERLTGFTRDELIGMNLLQLIDKKDLEITKKRLAEKSTAPITITVIRKDGSKFRADIESRNIDYKNEHARLLAIRDVTEKEKMQLALKERVKELNGFYSISKITSSSKPMHQMLQEIVEVIPSSWQFPELTYTKIDWNNNVFKTKNYVQNNLRLESPLKIDDKEVGKLTIGYTQVPYDTNTSRFLPEEKDLINGMAELINKAISQNHARQCLRESEERYKQLSNLTFEGIVIHENGIAKDINRSFAKVFGYEENEILYQNVVKKLIYPEDIPVIQENIIKEYALPYEVRAIKKDGTVFPLEIEARNTTYKGKQTRVAAVRDITRRKKAEMALVQSENDFRFLSQSAIDILALKDQNRILHYVGSKLSKRLENVLVSLHISEDKNLLLYNIYHNGESIKNNLVKTSELSLNLKHETKQIFPLGKLKEYEKEIKTLEGIIFNSQVIEILTKQMNFSKSYGIGLTEGEGFFSGIMLLAKKNYTLTNPGFIESFVYQASTALKEQVTRQKMLESKNEAQRANRVKSEFIANISHEIRTPMNIIIGFTEILKEKLQNSGYENYLEGIYTSGRSLVNLINDILDLSKIEAGKLDIEYHTIDIRHVINEIKQIFDVKANIKNLGLQIQIADNFPNYICFSDARLRQVLFNLVGNAIKFTGKGNIKIKVLVKNLHDTKIDFAVKVIDSGIGLEKNDLDEIFEPFKQKDCQKDKKAEGTGLGLSITKKLVEAMNGSINVESEYGRGSIFTVSFKNIDIIKTPVKIKSGQHENIRFKSQTILIVDDMESNRMILQDYLDSLNLAIVQANNGREALRMVKENNPSVVILDIYMPGMDGTTVAKKIKETAKFKNIKIIGQSVSRKLQENDKYFDHFLIKPILKKDLVEVLMKFLEYEKLYEQPQPIGKNNFKEQMLDYEGIEGMEKLAKHLTGLKPQVDKLKKQISMPGINELSGKIASIAIEYDVEPLIHYASKLKNAAQNFDIAEITNLLDKFSLICDTLEEMSG